MTFDGLRHDPRGDRAGDALFTWFHPASLTYRGSIVLRQSEKIVIASAAHG
jgi:hypothetical protein